jgi:hypothetical protein
MFSPSSALISDDLKPIWAEHNDRWWAEPVCALHGTLNPLALSGRSDEILFSQISATQLKMK